MPIYTSPATSITPIDIVSSELPRPAGVPSIIIGTSKKGIPFVPITVANFSSYKAIFGDIDGEKFGPIAMKLWLKHRSAGTYIKLLGIGDGKDRVKTGEQAGTVRKAGFVVGSQQVQTASGLQTHNEKAYLGGPPGRTYFLGCFMSESAGSTIFSDAGIQTPGENKAHPIIRGVLLAASGVRLSLNTEAALNNTPSGVATDKFSTTGDAGLSYGDILLGAGDEQKFAVILNGFKPNNEFDNVITASFDPTASSLEDSLAKPLRSAFNTDPTKLEQAGHYLRLFYDIDPIFAVPTASNITSHTDTNGETSTFTDGVNAKLYQTAFLMTASLARNSGSQTTATTVGVPNFENFENRYQNAFSPFVISQNINGKVYDLFRVHSRDEGLAASNSYKITIDSLDTTKGLGASPYPKFSLHVRRLDQPDKELSEVESTLETWNNLTLDPSDEKFISKVIGDQHVFYDFDKDDDESQKVDVVGNYPGNSKLIRIEVSPLVAEGAVPKKSLPTGFRGIYHLVTSGSTTSTPILTGTAVAPVGSVGSLSSPSGISEEASRSAVQPPLKMRSSIFEVNDAGAKVVNNSLTWGIQVERIVDLNDPNSVMTFDESVKSHFTYMPDFHRSYQNAWVGDNSGKSDVDGCVFDADRFNNNIFTLERLEVLTSSNNTPDEDQWAHARYRRSNKPAGVLQNNDGVFKKSRLLNADDLTHPESQKYYKFTFPLIGGFDGVNIFDSEKANFTNTAIVREIDDPAQGGRKGPTVVAYEKALKILEDKRAHPGSILAIPGIRHPFVVDGAVELANTRADIFYIFDLQEKNDLNVTTTGSFTTTDESLKNTRNDFLNNPRSTTYAAAFFPDIRMDLGLPPDGTGLPGSKVPPTVGVLGAMSREVDFAKVMGPTRGKVEALDTALSFEDEDIDAFFQAGINIISGPTLQEGTVSTDTNGPFIRSQNTLMSSLTPITRISVRRMLLLVRSRVRATMRNFLFDKLTPGLYLKMRNALTETLVTTQAQGAFKFFQIAMPRTLQENQEAVNNNRVDIKILIRPNDVSEDLIVDFSEDEEDE